VTLQDYQVLAEQFIQFYCVAKKIPIKKMMTDDNIGLAIEAIIYADMLYNPDKGASLRSFRIRGVMLAQLGSHKKVSMKTINYGLTPPASSENNYPIDFNKETVDHILSKVELEEFQRKLIQLRFYENKTFTEIAKELNCSRQNAEQCLKRTLDKLNTYVLENNVVI
jgi:RNA polymerase sigma factor (sigma-70 family)